MSKTKGRLTMWAVLSVLLIGTLSTIAHAQDVRADAQAAEEPLTVGVYIDPPFVVAGEGGYGGMAIDLWTMLSQSLGYQSEYVEYDTFAQLVDATANQEIDVAVTNLTITRDRAERIDFTHPWFDAGLRIMVRDTSSAGFWSVISGLNRSGHLRAYGWIAVVIILATLLLTLFDRHFDKNFPRKWPDGIAESFYTVMSVATSGKPPSRKNLFGWAGRIWQGLWLIVGIGVIAYVTSSVTSVMTTLSLTNDINNVSDLTGHTVGVFTGSVSERYARNAGLRANSYSNIDGAIAALAEGKIDAVIGDAPVLEYYASNHGDQSMSVVGPIFEPDKYGFGLPHQSALTRPLSIEIIGAHEDGQIATIREKYFGVDP